MTLNANSYLTSHEVARLLQVDPSSVKNWVNAGRLVCFKTPGGHRRVRIEALMEFLEKYSMPVPPQLFAALKKRVLVVDTDQANQRSMARLLKTYGSALELRFASSAYSAMFQAGVFQPQVMLIASRLDNVDASTVCEQLRLLPEAKEIRLVVMTSDPRPAAKKNLMSAGADALLNKPFELADVLEALQVDRLLMSVPSRKAASDR